MKKTHYLKYEGLSLVVAGVCIISSTYLGLTISRSLTALLFIVGGLFSYLFSQANTENKVPSNNQLVQGITLSLVGVLLFFTGSIDEYLRYITFFMLFIAIFEVTFGLSMLDTDVNIHRRAYIERMIAGAVGIIAASVVLIFSVSNADSRFVITGIVTILFGLGITRFSRRIKKIYLINK